MMVNAKEIHDLFKNILLSEEDIFWFGEPKPNVWRLDRHLTLSFIDEPSLWWKRTYYAITSHRVLIFEQGQIRDYWHIILDKPILSKNKRGTGTIQLFSKHFEAKKQHTPVLDSLRHLEQGQAEEALNILEQAREEALDTRAHKMGLD